MIMMIIMINRLRTLISMKKTKTNKKISTQEYIYIYKIFAFLMNKLFRFGIDENNCINNFFI